MTERDTRIDYADAPKMSLDEMFPHAEEIFAPVEENP